MAGITIQPEAMEMIGRLQNDDADLEFIILQISKDADDGQEYVVVRESMVILECKKECEETGGEEQRPTRTGWSIFHQRLCKYTIAYGIAYIRWKTKEGVDHNKLIYVQWNTDSAKMDEKMKYSSTKRVSNIIPGVVKHQASDKDDITYKEVLEDKMGIRNMIGNGWQ